MSLVGGTLWSQKKDQVPYQSLGEEKTRHLCALWGAEPWLIFPLMATEWGCHNVVPKAPSNRATPLGRVLLPP